MRLEFISLAGMLVCFVSWLLASDRMVRHIDEDASIQVAPLARFDPKLINILFAGEPRLYHEFLTNWLAKELSDPKVSTESSNQIFTQFDVMARHEPKVEWFYIGACAFFSEKLQRPDLCFSVTGYGQKALPNSWRIPALQSYIESAKLNRSERARYFLEIAAKKPNAPAEISARLSNTADGQILFTTDEIFQLIGTSGIDRFINSDAKIN